MRLTSIGMVTPQSEYSRTKDRTKKRGLAGIFVTRPVSLRGVIEKGARERLESKKVRPLPLELLDLFS